MRVFLDFEASSLGKSGFPIEVAWVFEDGTSTSTLIRPLPEWSDWSVEAEGLHGISRQQLEREGRSPQTVAREMVDALSGHALHASAPSWDGKWLSTLLRGGGLPRHALRLGKSDDVFLQVARDVLEGRLSEEQLLALVDHVIEATRPASPTHRALPDALLELERFDRVRESALKIRADNNQDIRFLGGT